MSTANDKSESCAIHSTAWLPKHTRLLVSMLLGIHAALLAWGAYRHSPTLNEPGHLVAGIRHWKLGQFELYRVNPPLVRMIAALPVLAIGAHTEWHTLYGGPGARPAFHTGADFVAANGERSLWLFTVARWTCIPFSLLGGYVCFLWARDLYGAPAGFLALTLWCFSPNILAHGQLITPDMGATSLGILAAYVFWRWLKRPSWAGSVAAATTLGLAELTKLSLLLFFGFWPIIWFIFRITQPRSDRAHSPCSRSIAQLALILCLAIYIVNLGYGFDGSMRPLREFEFVSETFAGAKSSGIQDSKPLRKNRFDDSWLAALPAPFPKDYILGIDVQKRDFENFCRPSYLRGEFRDRGWWYYYLYALAIKVPLGTWTLLVISCLARYRRQLPKVDVRDEITLTFPALALLVFVSSQTGFSHHMRYVLPVFPFIFIFIGQAARLRPKSPRSWRWLATMALAWSIASSLVVYPHSLSYFNELVGGPKHGHKHLISSNIDWGQDLIDLKEWIVAHPEARPLCLFYYGYLNPRDVGVDYELPEVVLRTVPGGGEMSQPTPGWYAISVNLLRGYPWWVYTPNGEARVLRRNELSRFLKSVPVARAGYSIYVYHVPPERDP